MEVPYFHTDSLLVAASLTGANIFSTLVRTLQEWMWDLNVEGIPSETQLYERLVSLAEDKPDTSLSIQVTLWGERHDPDQAGAVGNVTPRNLSMGDVSSAMFRGIVENLRTMMSEEIFRSLQVLIISTVHTRISTHFRLHTFQFRFESTSRGGSNPDPMQLKVS